MPLPVLDYSGERQVAGAHENPKSPRPDVQLPALCSDGAEESVSRDSLLREDGSKGSPERHSLAARGSCRKAPTRYKRVYRFRASSLACPQDLSYEQGQ